MFTINNVDKMKSLSAFHDGKHYVIGFKNQKLARHVQCTLPSDPDVFFTKNNNFSRRQDTIAFHTSADLYVQKTSSFEDSVYHLDVVKYEDFMCYPIDKMLGIVLAEEIIDEDEYIMLVRCQVVIKINYAKNSSRYILKPVDCGEI
jgi:hypothetical protein